MNDHLPVVLFDIGGTNTRLGVSFDGETVSGLTVFPTPIEFELGIDTLAQKAFDILGDKNAAGASGGIAGPLNLEKTITTNPPNLPGWKDQPLKQRLQEKFSIHDVSLENDTAVVGLGEALKGAGRDKSIVAYMTVSTGVNGVRIVDKQIDRNAYGFEIGHQIVDIDNTAAQFGSGRGELEDFISGREVEKRFGKKAVEIEDESVWWELSQQLAVGVYNTILYWSPEIVILGGSLMNKIKVEDVVGYLDEIMDIFPQFPPIVKGELGDEGGLLGALKHYELQF